MAVTVIKNYTRRVVARKKSKTGLILGIALLVGGGIGVLAWYLHNKKKEELALQNAEQQANSETGTEPKKDAITEIGITAKNGTPIIVKEDKPKDTLTFQKWANVNKNAGLKEDGDFGKNTKKIWDLYKNEFQKLNTAPTFVVNTVLSPKAPLTRAMAYDRLFKQIGNISSAKFKKDISERWMEAEATLAKGLSFETKNVYLLKTDWIKA
jgi:hypothetical protein